MEIDQDGLSTLDEWGSRRAVIPAPVRGPYRTWRTRVEWLLIAVFLLLPWLKINGMPAVFINIPERRFILFGQVFLSHDAPLIFFILAIGTLTLALTTAIWGRIWCGWACPQTVFIDGIFRRIEEWIEGSYIERRRLRDESMSGRKFIKLAAKWLAFLAVSSIISHSFVAYFAGGENLINMMRGSPEENWNYFLLVTFMTLIVAFDFGWFREQFCIIMCPYGRFQSVLMDQDSLAIVYDSNRGEPRKARGDCVACNRCVQVCPTGIDIRKGLQMECIACTACIDACDEIMTKVKKPTKLIRYQTLNGLGIRWAKPRVLIYLGLLVLSLIGLTYSVVNRPSYTVTLLRAKDTPYQVLPDGQVINHFKLHLHNQTSHRQNFVISLNEADFGRGFKLTIPESQIEVKKGQDREVHFFILFPRQYLDSNGELQISLHLRESSVGDNQDYLAELVGPASSSANSSP